MSFSAPTHFSPEKSRLGMRALGTVLTLAILASLVSAHQALRLKINGNAATDAPIVVKGKTYVSLDALKAAGVVVQKDSNVIALTLPSKAMDVTGGANQQDGIEGKMGEWLFNGIWRFRVISLEPADASKGEAGWFVKMEIRNGSKFSGYSPGGTGWQGLSLVTEDGTSLPARSNANELSDPGLAQGAANTQTILFPTESTNKPTRLILRFDPKGLVGTPAALRFTVPNPTFRVDVANSKP